MFRRALDMLGMWEAGEDFPPLSTPKKRIQLCKYWLQICQFNNWKYLNHDWSLFPDVITKEQCYPTKEYLMGDEEIPQPSNAPDPFFFIAK